MKNRVFANVQFRHSYFEDGHFNSVDVEPLPETSQILRNHRAGIKYDGSGFRLFLAVDSDNNPFLNFTPGTRLYFRLNVTDSQWLLFSKYDHLPPQKYRLVTNVGNVDGATELSITTTDKPGKANQFALLELEVTQTMIEASASGPYLLTLSFDARPALWEFFLVTNFSQISEEFSVVDADPLRNEDPILFRALTADETAVMPMQARLKDQLLNKNPNAICVHYVSHQAITCRQQGIKNIQLVHQGSQPNSTSRLMNNLPNPNLNNISRFIANAGDNSQAQDSFFQVVKYITHSFSTNGI